MPLITDSITYNVRQRGRRARGQDRNFDTVALAALINGPAVQERVKLGDMVGYYGHWPRIKLGMDPGEGGVVDGQAVSIAPALRTLELKADIDGTITHRAEFLDTEPGEIAARLFNSKAGGFSSAIESKPRTTPAVPIGFYGFDFVNEPNYTTNRGHRAMLDSAGNPDLSALLDSALDLAAMGDETMVTLFDRLYEQHQLALDSLTRVSRDNELLLARLARTTGKTLDAVSGLEDVRVAPGRFDAGALESMRAFASAPMGRLQEPPRDRPPESPESAALQRMYGVKV